MWTGLKWTSIKNICITHQNTNPRVSETFRRTKHFHNLFINVYSKWFQFIMNQKDVSNVSNTCLISSGFLREVDQHIYFLWYQIFVWKNAVCKIMTNQEISATAKMFHKIVYLQEEVLLQQSDHIISVCVSCCHGNQVIMRWQDHHRIRRTWITDTRVFTVSQQNNSRYRIKPWFTSTLSS